MPNIERLIVASSPFQEFIMKTRYVYRWENPTKTSKYLFTYVVLWYFNLLLPGMVSFLQPISSYGNKSLLIFDQLSAIVYLVMQRRVHGNNIDDLREDIKHREDVTRTALSLTELVVKEGDEKWADDVLERLGPWLMVQLADLANFFESVRK